MTNVLAGYLGYDATEGWSVVEALLAGVAGARHGEAEVEVCAGGQAGLGGPGWEGIEHTPVITQVVEDALETSETAALARVVGRLHESCGVLFFSHFTFPFTLAWYAVAALARLLHGRLEQTVRHLVSVVVVIGQVVQVYLALVPAPPLLRAEPLAGLLRYLHHGGGGGQLHQGPCTRILLVSFCLVFIPNRNHNGIMQHSSSTLHWGLYGLQNTWDHVDCRLLDDGHVQMLR